MVITREEVFREEQPPKGEEKQSIREKLILRAIGLWENLPGQGAELHRIKCTTGTNPSLPPLPRHSLMEELDMTHEVTFNSHLCDRAEQLEIYTSLSRC